MLLLFFFHVVEEMEIKREKEEGVEDKDENEEKWKKMNRKNK